MTRHILAWIVLATVAFGLPRQAFLTQWKASKSGDTHFTITFDSGTPPATVVLGVGGTYAGPASTETTAEYDGGDGVWTGYTSNTITLNGSYLKFRGDWRDAVGTYMNMFYQSFASAAYTCRISGTLAYAATTASAYQSFFRANSTIMTLVDNPLQPITGSPAAFMFFLTFQNANFTGTLPAGTLNTSGLTGSPAAYMFAYTFQNANFTGTLPAGTLDTSGLTGSPESSMFIFTFSNSAFTGGNLTIGSGIALTSANVVNPFNSMFSGASDWTGQVYWGVTLLTTAIPIPDSDINTFAGCVNMPGYAGINANWK